MFCTIALYAAVHAQTLAPVVIASAGKSLTGGNLGMEYTVGEVATSTLTMGSDHLTQGFNQPKITITALDPKPQNDGIVVYPNPTEEFVTVECGVEEELLVSVHDALGQTVIRATFFSQKTTLDLHSFANGPYLLTVTRQNGEPVKSFSIIKRSTY